MKQCIGCKENKSKDAFYKVAANKDGLHKYCIPCCKVSRALEGVRKRDKKVGLSRRQEWRAKDLGIHYEEGITLEQVFRKYRGMCVLCKKWVMPKLASMDHIQPLSKGGTHILDNIQLTHIKCNLRKSNNIIRGAFKPKPRRRK